jgi:hypothetical protein
MQRRPSRCNHPGADRRAVPLRRRNQPSEVREVRRRGGERGGEGRHAAQVLQGPGQEVCGKFDLWPTGVCDVLSNQREGRADVQREEERRSLQGSQAWSSLCRQPAELLRRVRRNKLFDADPDTVCRRDDDHEAAADPDDDAAVLTIDAELKQEPRHTASLSSLRTHGRRVLSASGLRTAVLQKTDPLRDRIGQPSWGADSLKRHVAGR